MDKPGCIMCEYVIHKIQHFLSENKTEEEIENALEQVCGYMPKAVRPQCDHVVETYGPAIIEMLAGEVDPQQICTMMHLCDQQGILKNNYIPNLKLDSKSRFCAYFNG